MKRCAVTLASGGRIIVKGDFDNVTARLMGGRGGFIHMVRVERDGHGPQFIERSVLIAVEAVTCVYEVQP